MDPGPYGCLGAGPGQAIGAKTAHPDRQVVCLLADGAFGFSEVVKALGSRLVHGPCERIFVL